MEIDRLKAANPIEDVAREYGITFNASGRGRCAFPERHNNGDANPSLHLDRTQQLVRCESQNCFDGAVDVIGLVEKMESIDFKEAVGKLTLRAGLDNGHTRPPAQGSPRIVATFDYCDEAGKLLFQTLRKEPGPGGKSKDFLVRRPDGKGGWIYKREDVRLVPYRLQELMKSEGPVVKVAGEKCVDVLHSLEITATTNPFGEGDGNWKPEYNAFLKGREVILWPDKDDIGQRHAEAVGRSLQGVAASIRWLEPPAELPDKGDVADGVQKLGWTREKVLQLLQEARPWGPADKGEDTSHPKIEEDEEGEEAKKRESPAAEIVKLVLQEAELFHDETRTPFARVQIKSHRENWRCESEGFSLWLQRRVFEEKGRPPSSEAIAQALGVIKGKALFEGSQHPLNLRAAWHEGALWYDLSDPAWRAVRITPQGWAVCSDPPILFTRYKHQAAQVDPVAGGDVRRLFEFVSVADEGARLLLLVWLASSFIPGFPHPIPVLHGPQGSGKSSIFRTLRKLVDPSVLEVLTFPRDVTELVQKLSHHWAALFDNVTGLSGWQSDALCRAVTGEGFSKRALYTNDEDHIYHFQRCIGLNGINIVATRADLLDRAILIGLERIAPQQRKTEEEMEAAFAEARPQILGGIFDALVRALRLKAEVKLARLPRMADFARWGCAIAQALDYQAEEFLAAYTGNLQQQNREVIEGHPVAAAVMGLMEDRDAWEGEPAALLKALEDVAERKRITTKGHGWPGAAHVLTRRLKEVKTNLQEAGVLLEGGHSGRRLVQIRKIASEASEASGALKDKGLQADATWTLLDAPPNSVQMASSDSTLNNKELDAMDAMDASLPTQTGAGLRHVEI